MGYVCKTTEYGHSNQSQWIPEKWMTQYTGNQPQDNNNGTERGSGKVGQAQWTV